MNLIAIIVAAIGGVSALLARLEPNAEQAQLREARRTLHEAGIHYPKGSPEETRAIRILLDGGAPAEC